ncbi:MAG: NERD domain-containing protein [Candidatus Geothermincolia bacterium]
MARMIPTYEAGGNAHGEALFYQWLEEGLSDDYRVFHGVHLLTSSGNSMRRGETDFLILHRKKGFLVVEVKGGRVRRDASRNQWISISHDGKEHVIKDPFLQAEQNVNTLVKRIRDCGIFGRGAGPLPVTCGYAVAFPDGVAPDRELPLHVDRKIVMDYRDKGTMEARVEQLFEVWRKKRAGSREFTDDEWQAMLQKVLLARYEVTVPLSVRFEKEQEVFVALTETQCRFLEAIPDSKRALFKGYAGTGKTQLLMEKARRLAVGGARVLVVCYNQPLAVHLAQWAAGMALPGEDEQGSITVRNFHSLCEDYAGRAGLDYEVPEMVAEQQEFYEDVAPMLLEDSLGAVKERFDCVLVDEGQDFRLEWLEVVQKLLDPAGLDIFYIYYDEQQNVYAKELRFPFEAEPHSLNWNCRSTGNICEVTRKIGEVDIECFPGWVEGARVGFFGYRKPEEQVAIIEKIVKDLMSRKVEARRIMVISSHKRARSCLANVSRLNGYPLVEFAPPGEEDTIAFSSLHRAKGLESDIVIFCDVDGGEPYCSRANQYVAVSRARHMLFVVHRKDWRVGKAQAGKGSGAAGNPGLSVT